MNKLLVLFTFITFSIIASDNFKAQLLQRIVIDRAALIEELTYAVKHPESEQAAFFKKVIKIRTEMEEPFCPHEITEVSAATALTEKDFRYFRDLTFFFNPEEQYPCWGFSEGALYIGELRPDWEEITKFVEKYGLGSKARMTNAIECLILAVREQQAAAAKTK